ncbi:hypothetical protein, partial [Thalassoglobus neptunius]
GKLNGEYRSQMTRTELETKGYGRRWLVESFMSGLKRTTGAALESPVRRSRPQSPRLRPEALAHDQNL